MRLLSKNQTLLYLVSVQSSSDAVDGDGNFTGEKDIVYTAPVEINLSLYPMDGQIRREEFGKAELFDMMALSMDVELKESDLLFLQSPVSDYDTTYDYKVMKVLDSLNNYQYGLEKRI